MTSPNWRGMAARAHGSDAHHEFDDVAPDILQAMNRLEVNANSPISIRSPIKIAENDLGLTA
jgi:hypothetical protein